MTHAIIPPAYQSITVSSVSDPIKSDEKTIISDVFKKIIVNARAYPIDPLLAMGARLGGIIPLPPSHG